jgi:subfamily B ATP-binding cassette protein MsbA
MRSTRPVEDFKRLIRFLWPYARPEWRLIALTVVFTGLYGAASVSRGYLGGGVIDVILRNNENLTKEQALALWDQALLLAAFAGFLALGLGAFGALKDIYQEKFVVKVVLAIRERIMAHILSLSLRFFHRRKIGDLYSRLTSDVQQAHVALSYFFGDIAEDILTIAFGAAMCIWASPVLSLAGLVVGPLLVVPLLQFGKQVRKRARKRQGTQAETVETMQQMLSGVRTVKAFDKVDHELHRFHERNEALYRQTVKVVRIRSLSKGLLEGMNNGIVPLLLLGGIWLVANGWLAPGDLGTFLSTLVIMYAPARRLSKSFNQMQESLAGLDRLEEVLLEKPDLVDAPGAVALGEAKGEVRLRGVSFAYRKEEPVLREISLEARPGEVIAIVGPSGAGKSTLIDLVARFYDPDSGVVEVDGRDVREVTRASLVARMAIVTQEPFLFNDTVLENVRYGRPGATLEEAVLACKAANIHDAVAALPQGYDTVVGDRGATLSGGQRQRLTIARALLRDPRILLLDEATSALDSESERAVQAALERLMEGRTTLVVAHRLSTVAGATRTYVLDKGRVVEEGRHEELLARGGLYAKLWTLQSGGEGARASAAAV